MLSLEQLKDLHGIVQKQLDAVLETRQRIARDPTISLEFRSALLPEGYYTCPPLNGTRAEYGKISDERWLAGLAKFEELAASLKAVVDSAQGDESKNE